MNYDFLIDGEPLAPTASAKERKSRPPRQHLSPILPKNKLLRIRDVLDIVRVSRPTIYRLIASGDFPKPVTIGAARLWPENEINNWLITRIEARDE